MNASDVEVAEVALTGHTDGGWPHLPAGPLQMAEAALGPAGNVVGAGVPSLELENHDRTMFLFLSLVLHLVACPWYNLTDPALSRKVLSIVLAFLLPSL